MKDEQKFENVFNALILISRITDTDIGELIDALAGYAFNEE